MKCVLASRRLACLLALLLSASGERSAAGARPADRKPKTRPLVLFINYPYQIWAAGRTKIHLALLKPDFMPAVGAEVAVNRKAVGKTDRNGVLIFDYRPGNAETHTLAASLKDGGAAYAVAKGFRCNARTVSFESDHLFVYTDRGVYNPGQYILVRLMAWRLKGEYAPIDKAKVDLLLQDRGGRVYGGCHVRANEFGIGTARLPLPDNMPEGDYELVVLYKKAREAASIRVKRFVPPVIHIRHDLKRYLTDAQNRMAVEVELAYFSGAEMKGSTLALSALDPKGKEIFRRRVPQTARGKHAVVLSREELEGIRIALKREEEFKIRLTATDTYGRTDQVDLDVVYTARPFRAVLELDKDGYVAGETVQVLAKVVDLDGKPAAKIPLVLSLPGLNVKLRAATDAKGVALFAFGMGVKTMDAILLSPEMTAPIASRTVPFQAPKPLISKVAEPPKGTGATVKISASFAPAYVPVEKVLHLDLTDISGALVVATTIPIAKRPGEYVAQGKFICPTWGTMLCNLYGCAVKKSVIENQQKLGVQNVGFVTEGQYVTVHPDKTLRITAEGLKPRPRPGENVRFRLKVEGGKGEACLGASIVDHAVISLLDPLLKTPEQHFYDPRRKVIATGGAGVLTWPVVDRNWGSPWRDIAYTNWGWKDPGAFVGPLDPRRAATQPGGAGGLFSEEPAAQAPKPAPAKAGGPWLQKLPYSPGSDPDAPRARTRVRPKRITIRTRFPETCLWEPLLVTKNRGCELSVALPDAITNQQLTVVASDKTGHVGLLRRDIQVRQDLFVRSSLPAAMTLGDSLRAAALVRNLTDKAVACTASMTSPDLQIAGKKDVALKIPKGETAVAEWDVVARRCGPGRFTLVADAPAFGDSETRTIFVRPPGEPAVETVKGTLDRSAPWEARFALRKGAAYRTVFLNVSFPNVFPALQGLEAMARYPHGCVEQTASAAMVNAAVLEHGRKTGTPPDRLAALEQSLFHAAVRLAAMQYPDGAWAWFFLADATAPDSRPVVGGRNLYLTAYALRALGAIGRADVPVPDEAVAKAVAYIMQGRKPDGLWSSRRAFFWQTTNDATDMAFSAELFDVLVEAVASLPPETAKKHDQAMRDLRNRMAAYLKTRPEEPLAVAHAVNGLLTWELVHTDKAVRKLLDESVRYLVSLKRKAHWEPHWYHAFGGMVELNARILGLLRRTDAKRYDAYLREGVTWLLATREAWGAWHNTAGTAAAVRALLQVGAFAKERPSAVAVQVNGKLVQRIAIDPKDPYLSAAALRCLEITPFARDGDNQVAIAYDGNLKASVLLETRQWAPRQAAVAKPTGPLTVKRLAARKAALNQPIDVTIELTTTRPIPYLVIEERICANAEVEPRLLDQLRRSGRIAGYRLDGATLYLYLERLDGRAELAYRLTAVRCGKANHPGTLVTAMYTPALRASTVGQPLHVTD